mgnify:CR=1 FL=1
MQQNELTMAHIALNLDAPPAPAKVPTDPAFAVETCTQYLARCQRLLASAQTAQERESAELWVWNAENQLRHWQAALQRQSIR